MPVRALALAPLLVTSLAGGARAEPLRRDHPIMRSLEPGGSWGWCFPEEVRL